jgi:hypothetical protein
VPLNVDYSPVGAMGSLASAAGYGQGDAQASQQMIDLQRNLAQQTLASQDAQLRQQAFSLQKAHLDRLTAAQTRTPAADHIAERANFARQDRETQQKADRDQLDQMLQEGTIDQPTHERAVMASLSGNKMLMNRILATPKPPVEKDIPAAEEANWRRPFHDRRSIAERQIQMLHSEIKDAFGDEKIIKSINDQITPLKQAIEDSYDAEEKYVAQARSSYKTAKQKGTASVTPSGQVSITSHPEVNPSEANILSLARTMAGPNAGKIGGDKPTTVTAGGRQPPAEFPDAVWSDEHQMWTVIRNGRIMGVQ